MAFTDFKSPDQVQEAYQIQYIEQDFLDIKPQSPSEQFKADFAFAQTHFDIFSSEASRCEAVIYPLLREVCRKFVADYALWSHKGIAADAILHGTPDYMIAKRSELGKNVLGSPLVLFTEAKQNDFTQGWGQCLAELVAAQRLNQCHDLPVYGVVTDAEVWQFGKLDEKVFTKNLTRLTIDRLDEVFGALCLMMTLVSTAIQD